MTQVLEKLIEGDLRSIGKSPEVVELVLKDPTLFEELLYGMIHEDPGVRMRASDAVEKITRIHPEYLKEQNDFFIDKVLTQTQQEVRWHAAQMVARFDFDNLELNRVIEFLFRFLEDDSKIVQVNSLQALVDLAESNQELFPKALRVLEEKIETGSPAVKNRAQKLKLELVRNKD